MVVGKCLAHGNCHYEECHLCEEVDHCGGIVLRSHVYAEDFQCDIDLSPGCLWIKM